MCNKKERIISIEIDYDLLKETIKILGTKLYRLIKKLVNKDSRQKYLNISKFICRKISHVLLLIIRTIKKKHGKGNIVGEPIIIDKKNKPEISRKIISSVNIDRVYYLFIVVPVFVSMFFGFMWLLDVSTYKSNALAASISEGYVQQNNVYGALLSNEDLFRADSLYYYNNAARVSYHKSSKAFYLCSILLILGLIIIFLLRQFRSQNRKILVHILLIFYQSLFCWLWFNIHPLL